MSTPEAVEQNEKGTLLCRPRDLTEIGAVTLFFRGLTFFIFNVANFRYRPKPGKGLNRVGPLIFE